jgi:hypothetical protein
MEQLVEFSFTTEEHYYLTVICIKPVCYVRCKVGDRFWWIGDLTQIIIASMKWYSTNDIQLETKPILLPDMNLLQTVRTSAQDS